ncbi:S41 family peptidase [Acanthopleuribacter pedis]|uniref:Tricorn protease homolog n=1 Tax=Acanthopleuribacter pedis TaxID=442870 RepID=A0A8J7U7Y4_9BACT|nr:S41 family peptidase [Acanthopleuribacter pedis]MBO1321891.1 PD40 domain-containing protein [Acanthopleuribacter pedis]
MRLIGCILCALLHVAAFAGEGDARLLRFPDIHQDQIVFVAGGDLHLVSAQGGVAKRLTSHPGRELFPKFSPDGKWIAFSAEYNGTRQVYVMSAEGGAPRQLTYYNDVGPMPPRGGFDYQVMDWSPDGKHILFRGNRLPWGPRMGRFYTIPVEGGMEQPLAIPESGGGMYAPDGKSIVYTPISREWRTWKRTRGGRAQDVWTYNLENNTSKRLTTHIMTDNQPMWVGDQIYFTSDRNFTLNLFRVSPEGSEPVQVTQHDTWDALWPSAGPEQIVYENGGYLRVYHPAKNEDRQVSIQLVGDFPHTMAYRKNVRDFIDGFDISPSGKRLAITARGDLFSVPAKDGPVRTLMTGSKTRQRNPIWSPDGKWVAYLSDETGEYQLHVVAQDGGEPRQITRDFKMWPLQPEWSPDSKTIAIATKDRKLYLVDVASGDLTEVHKGVYGDVNDFSWSPDSRWLAYTRTADNQFSVIWVYDLAGKKHHQLTSHYISNFNPVFSPDGKYLYFLSNRDYNLSFSGYEFNYQYTNPTRIYAATLNADVDRPFAPKIDEVAIAADKPEAEAEPKEDKKGKGKKGKKDKKDKKDKNDEDKKEKADDDAIVLTVDGFEDRVFVLPMSSGRYLGLSAVKGGVLYVQLNDNGPAALKHFDMKSEKDKTVLKRVNGYRLSAKGTHILYRSGRNIGVVEAKPDQKPKHLKLNELEVKINPREEWTQIYHDAYLLMRDFFYDPNMHGYDWDALTERYRPLVNHVRTRHELDYILGELGGELNAGHYYVNSGDNAGVDRDASGLLGIEVTAHASGFYQISEILPGENWHPTFRSPLRDVGVSIPVGSFILAVDGVSVTTKDNFYMPLEGKGNQVVSLLVNDKPSREGARDVLVRTVTSETNLRYLKWVRERAAMVDKLSNGRVGYIHLPNTAFDGNRELFKHFYAQIDKDALLLDDRYNGGGFIPVWMIELLKRPVYSHWGMRDIKGFRSPTYAHTGPKAVLINHYSSSGGDAFPYYMRRHLGAKLFGTRTWGGLIGLQGNPGFVDGGGLSIPLFRFFDAETGNWEVENEGVEPDVEIYDRPEQIAKGEDPTLEAGVAHLLEELKKNPPKELKMPPAPNENKRN